MKLNIFLIILSFTSCSFVKKPEQKQDNIYQGVSLKEADDHNIVEISPSQFNLDFSNHIAEEDTFAAIYYKEGIYNLAFSLGVAQQIASKEDIYLYIGEGLGAVLAMMSAFHDDLNIVEWKWFKLLAKLKKERFPYSISWQEKLISFIKAEYPNLKFSQLKRALAIPVCKNFEHSRYIDEGSFVEALKISLKNPVSDKEGSCIGAARSFRYLRSLKVEKLTIINPIDRNFTFKYPQGYLYGLFGSDLSKAKEDYLVSKINSVGYNSKGSSYFIDDTGHTAKLILKGKKFDLDLKKIEKTDN